MIKNKEQSLFKFTGQLGFAGIFSKLISLPHSIVYAKFLMPSGYGILQLINVIISYFGYIQMGILQAVTRNVPRAYSKNNFKKAKEIKDLAFTWLSSLTLLGLIFLWIFYLTNKEFKSTFETFYIVMLSFIIITHQLNNFMKPILKADGEFDTIGKIAIFNSLTSSIIGIAMVLLFNLKGAIIAIFINNFFLFVVTIFYYQKYLPKIFFRFNLLYEQMSKGLLIYIYRRSEEIIKTLSLIIIGYYYGVETVGIFSFGFISLNSVYKYSSSIRIYFYREIMIQNELENKYFLKLFSLPHIFNLFFNTILLVVFSIIYLCIIYLFLPKYIDSIPVIYFSLFGLIVFNSRSFCNQYFDATNQLKKLIIYILFGLVLGLCLCIYFSYFKFKIYFIAISCSFCYSIMSILSIYNAFLSVTNSSGTSFLMILKIIFISLMNSLYIYQLNLLIEQYHSNNYLYIILMLVLSLPIIFVINYLIFSFFFRNEKFMTIFNKYFKIFINEFPRKISF